MRERGGGGRGGGEGRKGFRGGLMVDGRKRLFPANIQTQKESLGSATHGKMGERGGGKEERFLPTVAATLPHLLPSPI